MLRMIVTALAKGPATRCLLPTEYFASETTHLTKSWARMHASARRQVTRQSLPVQGLLAFDVDAFAVITARP